MSARVRVNAKRSPLKSQDVRVKQRRVLENPDVDEVLIGEVPVNEEVELLGAEASATEFDDWQQTEYEGILCHEHTWSSKFGGCKQGGHQNTLGADTRR